MRIALVVTTGLALWACAFLLVEHDYDAVTCLLWASWSPVGPCLVWWTTWIAQRVAHMRAWAESEEGRRLDRAVATWWVAKARVEAVSPVAKPILTRVYATRNHAGRVAHESEARAFVELGVRLLPVGGGAVTAHDQLSVPVEELGALKVGAIITVLYDPDDPQRFCIDSLERDGTTIDGATLRTKAAEERAIAAQRLRLSDASYR